PPMSRLPTELTSSTLPFLTLIFWLPTSTTFSGLTAAAGTSPATAVVPGLHGCVADASVEDLSLDFLSFLLFLSFALASVEAGAGVQSAAESLDCVLEVDVGAGSFEVP